MKLVKIIETSYYGPTTYKGSRIRAKTDDAHPIFVNYQSDLDLEQNHKLAADTLIKKIQDERKEYMLSIGFNHYTLFKLKGYCSTKRGFNFVYDIIQPYDNLKGLFQ